MEIKPQIFTAKVMHKRLFPKPNTFVYGVYYLALPLSKLYKSETSSSLAINRLGMLSFHEKDHGDGKGNIEKWIRNILAKYSLNTIVRESILITMPRVFGYVFNPVSFWFCLDKRGDLRAVLSEVNNTFGETHSYLCMHMGAKVIKHSDWIEAKKLFHVSPFLKRKGKYRFRFSLKTHRLGIWIDFYDEKGNRQLITSLVGTLDTLNKKSLRKVFIKHPLITVKTIFLIHWQAIKLVTKGIKYISKPEQIKQKLSHSCKVKKM